MRGVFTAVLSAVVVGAATAVGSTKESNAGHEIFSFFASPDNREFCPRYQDARAKYCDAMGYTCSFESLKFTPHVHFQEALGMRMYMAQQKLQSKHVKQITYMDADTFILPSSRGTPLEQIFAEQNKHRDFPCTVILQANPYLINSGFFSIVNTRWTRHVFVPLWISIYNEWALKKATWLKEPDQKSLVAAVSKIASELHGVTNGTNGGGMRRRITTDVLRKNKVREARKRTAKTKGKNKKWKSADLAGGKGPRGDTSGASLRSASGASNGSGDFCRHDKLDRGSLEWNALTKQVIEWVETKGADHPPSPYRVYPKGGTYLRNHRHKPLHKSGTMIYYCFNYLMQEILQKKNFDHSFRVSNTDGVCFMGFDGKQLNRQHRIDDASLAELKDFNKSNHREDAGRHQPWKYGSAYSSDLFMLHAHLEKLDECFCITNDEERKRCSLASAAARVAHHDAP